MPKVIQQKAVQSTNGLAPVAIPSGGMLGTVVNVSYAVDTRLSLLLYGRNRIGKTTLACQFEKPALLLSIEPTKTGGALSVSNIPGVQWRVISPPQPKGKALLPDGRPDPFGHVSCSERLAMLASELKTGNHPFKTVILDSVGSWEKVVLQEIMGSDQPLEMLKFGKVSQDEYTLRSEKMRDAIGPFLGLSCHCVVLANEKDHNPPEGRKSALVRRMQDSSFFSADAGSGLARWLADSCDYVCQMFMDEEVKITKSPGPGGRGEVEVEERTGNMIRRLRLKYHPNYAAGGRIPLEEDDSVPEFVDGHKPKDLHDNLMKAIRKYQERKKG